MLFVLGAAVVALNSAPPPQAADTLRSEAYLDASAQTLVERARERRRRVESGIEAYQTTARQRIYAGMRVVGRNRTLYSSEIAARVHWRRSAPGEIRVLGAREAVPVAERGARAQDDVAGPRSDAVSLAFDPDRLQVGFSASAQHDSSSTEFTLIDPLGAGSEAHYRFAAGDSVAMRFPNGRVIRLRELKVIPRRSDSRLLRGSVWLDEESYGAVRGVFTLARPFDLARDLDEDIPGVVRALGPMRARLDRMTMEFALVQGRWWLPHRVYLDATAEAGALGAFPVRFEQSYAEYRVQGTGAPELAALPGGTSTDTVAVARQCRDEGRSCREWRVSVPTDTAALLTSPELQPSLAQAGEVMATDRELADLGRTLERITGSAADPTPRVQLPDLSSFRFNRVEGPSFGVRGEMGVGRLALDGSARLGAADWEPAVEAGVSRRTMAGRMRLAGYRRLAAFDPYAQAPTLGSALNALLLGRDEADYLRATGVEITREPQRASRWELSWRLFGEHQHPVVRETDLTLSRAWDESPYPEVRPAERADQVGAAFRLRTATDDPYGSVRRELALTLDAQAGTFRFARPALSAGMAAPLPAGLSLSLGAAAGTSFGDVPVQGLWYLGGPGSVRGFRTAFVGGEAFWRGRAELARGQPAFRLALFADAGWAGARSDVQLDPALVAAGAGISTLDGILRLDLARALRGGDDWRADLYLNGAF